MEYIWESLNYNNTLYWNIFGNYNTMTDSLIPQPRLFIFRIKIKIKYANSLNLDFCLPASFLLPHPHHHILIVIMDS